MCSSDLMAEARCAPLHLVDLGVGNGWLSYRAALAGHRATAIDIREDDVDGLGAAAALGWVVWLSRHSHGSLVGWRRGAALTVRVLVTLALALALVLAPPLRQELECGGECSLGHRGYSSRRQSGCGHRFNGSVHQVTGT